MLMAKNNKAVGNFKRLLVGSMVSFSRSTIQQAAQMGLDQIVNSVGFNDYTGKLINSYQAAIITKGGMEERLQRQFGEVFDDRVPLSNLGKRGKKNNAVGVGGGKIPIMLTSLGTTKIHHETSPRGNNGGRGFRIRNRRDGGESPDVRRMHMVNGRYEKDYREGYGFLVSRIKGIAPPIKSGYWLVFDNGAANVSTERGNLLEIVDTQGPRRHRVFPAGLKFNLFGIGEKELKKTIARYKRKYH